MSKGKNLKHSLKSSVFHSTEKYDLLCDIILKENLFDYLKNFNLASEEDETFNRIFSLILSKHSKNATDRSKTLLKEALTIFKSRIIKDIDKLKNGEIIISPLANWRYKITIYMAKLLANDLTFRDWFSTPKQSLSIMFIKMLGKRIFNLQVTENPSINYFLGYLGNDLVSDFKKYSDNNYDETIDVNDRFKRPKFLVEAFTEEEEAYFRRSYKIKNNIECDETGDVGESSSEKDLNDSVRIPADFSDQFDETDSKVDDSECNDCNDCNLNEETKGLTTNFRDNESNKKEEETKEAILVRNPIVKTFEKPESPSSTSQNESQIPNNLDLSRKKYEPGESEGTDVESENDLKRRRMDDKQEIERNSKRIKTQAEEEETKAVALLNDDDNSINNSEMFDSSSVFNITAKIRHQKVKQSLNAVKLLVHDRIFIVRPSIISAFSPIFEDLFERMTLECNDTYIEIPDVDPDLMSEFIGFIYTNSVNNIENIVCELWVLAIKYQVDELRKLCEDSLHSANITTNNVVSFLIIADSISNDNLITRAIEFISIHRKQIVDTDEFLSMEKTHPHLLSKIFRFIIATQ